MDSGLAHGVRAPAPEALPPGQRSVPATEPLYLNTVMEFDSLEGSLAVGSLQRQ